MKIAIAGSVLVDRINEIAAYPHEGELTQIRRVSRAVGGCVPNVAIDIKRVDPSLDVLAVGCVGRDDDAEFVISTLRENGVDTAGICHIDETTSFTDVMSVAGGQRTFFTYPGACAVFGYEHVSPDTLEADMLHLGYFLLLDKVDGGEGAKILKRAQERGIRTSLDMVSENSDRYHIVKACLPYTDNLIINELEAGKLCGIEPTEDNLPAIAKAVKDMGVTERVIIHTPALSVCCSDNGCFSYPSIKLPAGFIKGTTGAGDAFCAGALIGISRGLSESAILDLASRAAVASLTAPDSICGMRCEDEINCLYDSLTKN